MNRLLLLISAALLTFGVTTVNAQLITNGTFTTDASGWSLASACNDAVWNGAVGNPAGAVRLNSCGENTADPTASQTINGLVIGATYTIQVDVQLFANSSGAGSGKSFGIFLDNQPGNPLMMTEFLDGAWHTITTTFVASSTSHTVIFAAELDVRTPNGPVITDVAYNIDNVSVTPVFVAPIVPVPSLSEQALVILGLLLAAGAAVALRKRRAFAPKTK